MKKLFIISGEASGDLHGSNLIKHIKINEPTISIQAWGGDLMEQQGATVVKHYSDLAFMGFSEVIKNINTIRKNFALCKQQIQEYKPDAIVYIDYPGFNIRIAKWAKEQGYVNIYYISPQLWAWKESRIHILKKVIDKMMVILPFEQDYYANWGMQVDYVGHPLVDVIKGYKQNNTQPKANNIIALLPGSRKQEITEKLPIMLKMAHHFTNYQFVVAVAPGMDENFYKPMMAAYTNVQTVRGSTYKLLSQATAALVTSGTATLETALFKVPQVVCYKGSKLSYLIAKRLVKIPYISLVNLISNKLVVQELIQDNFNEHSLKEALDDTLMVASRSKILEDYITLEEKLTEGGNASANAAKIVCRYL